MLRQIFSLSLLFVLVIGGSATAQSAPDVRTMQIQLQALGFEVGSTDGVLGPRTHDAVIAFQRAFGLAETGRLSLQGEDLLKRSSGIAAQSSRVAVAARRLNRPLEHVFMTGNPDVPNIYYANGAHFVAVLQRWNGRPDQTQARFSVARNLAAEQSDYDAALVDLDMWAFDIVDYSSKTLPAIETLVAEARRQPNDVTHLNTILRKIGGRFVEDLPGECRVPDVAARTSNVIENLLDLHVANGGGPSVGGNLSGLLAVCLEGNSALLAHDRRIEFASMIGPSVAALAHHDKALVAHAIGNYSVAREHFEQMLRLDELAGPDETKMTFGLETIERLHAVGLADDARKLATGVVNAILASPRDRFAQVTIMGDSDREYLQAVIATLLVLDRIELIDQLEAHVVLGEGAQGLAQAGISYLVDTERWIAAAPAAAKLAERFVSQNQAAAASALKLQEAEAWLQHGDYSAAERALARAQVLSGIEATQETLAKIAATRARLGLSPQEAVDPADAAAEGILLYLGDSCQGNQVDSTFVDHEVLGRDPYYARRILDHGVLEAFSACKLSSWQLRFFARTYCSLAAIAGRKELVDAFLDAEFSVPRFYPRGNYVGSCAFGLADAGAAHWLFPYKETIARIDDVPILHVLATEPEDRPSLAIALLRHYEATREPNGRNPNHDLINRIALLTDLSDGERRQAKEAVGRTFIIDGSGASARAYEFDAIRESAFQIAVGYQRLGLHGLAEAHLSVNNEVEPARFAETSAEDLNSLLFDWNRLRWRLLHAEIAYAQGRIEAAEGAVIPVVEAAVRRFSDAETELPGTIEQWSERLAGYFSLYLSLQFDRQEHQRNTDVVFFVQQYLQAAGSTAGLTVLEQRRFSLSPELARAYQDVVRDFRIALRNRVDPAALEFRAAKLQEIETRLPADDSTIRAHQIGVIRPLAAAQQGLPKASALLVATQLEKGIAISYVRQSSARTHWINWSSEETKDRIDTLRRGLEPSVGGYQFDEEIALDLYDALIGWAAEGAPPPDLRMVIDGPLASLPFGALLTEASEVGWLGRQSALSHSPSVARATRSTNFGDKRQGLTPFIGFGDPELASGGRPGWEALLGNEAWLPTLPETRRELFNMSHIFQGDPTADVYVGSEATETKLLSLSASGALAEARVVAFATHGLLGRRETGSLDSPAIMLSPPETSAKEDGLLTAPEVFGLRLAADLVILAACDTGVPNADEGISELASAFFYAGAENLLLTHYKTNDGSSLEITTVLADQMSVSDDVQTAEALRAAIDFLLENQSHSAFHSPVHWANYFVMI